VKLKTYGAGFEGVKEIEIPTKAATYEATIDLAALKLAPGDYTIAFYGSAVSKYRYNAAAVPLVEAEQKKAEQRLAAAAAEAKKIAATDAAASKAAAEKEKQAETAMANATKRMKAVTTAATPTDTVDIVVSEPI